MYLVTKDEAIHARIGLHRAVVQRTNFERSILFKLATEKNKATDEAWPSINV
jgi:hypothetical protein